MVSRRAGPGAASGAGTADGGSTPVRLIVATGLAFEARLARRAAQRLDGVVVVSGLGADAIDVALGTVLARLARQAPPPPILSFGTAGGLDPVLRVGDWIVADALAGIDGASFTTDAALRQAICAALPDARVGGVAACREPLASAASKHAHRLASGARAADMESEAIAIAAARHGLPFGVCRVVVDEATRTLPPAALAGMRPDGRAAIAPVLAALLRHPADLSGLLGLARAASRARRRLQAGASPVFAACMTPPAASGA